MGRNHFLSKTPKFSIALILYGLLFPPLYPFQPYGFLHNVIPSTVAKKNENKKKKTKYIYET